MSVLLDSLSQGIDAQTLAHLSDPQLRSNIESYLSELLVNDDLLSTESFTTTTSTKRTLTEEIADLDSQAREISVKLAKITNDNREMIIDVNSDLGNAQDTLKALQSAVETAHDMTKKPLDLVVNSSEQVKTTSAVLANTDSILDILELPTLCRACVVQGNYQDALEISHLAKSLVIRFPKIYVFAELNRNVEAELQSMVRGLVRLLGTNVKQGQILKIFQILNSLGSSRLGDFDSWTKKKTGHTSTSVGSWNSFLKSLYITSRLHFVTNEISHLKPLLKTNKLTYIKRYVEIYREHIFNALSVYQVIFGPQDVEDLVIVTEFVREVAQLLVQVLRELLPQIVGDQEIDAQASKDGLILQLLYLCRSLSKFQVDFEVILVQGLDGVVEEKDWVLGASKLKKFR